MSERKLSDVSFKVAKTGFIIAVIAFGVGYLLHEKMPNDPDRIADILLNVAIPAALAVPVGLVIGVIARVWEN
jgi:ABC-type sulfate transport system permease subunit